MSDFTAVYLQFQKLEFYPRNLRSLKSLASFLHTIQFKMMEIQVVVATSVIGLFVGIFFYIMKIFKDASLQEKDKVSNISLTENEFEEPSEKPRRKSENVSNF